MGPPAHPPRPGPLERAEALAGVPGTYTLQAAIAACHARARTPEDTDWSRIAELYAALADRTASPVVELNRAVAVAMASGPADGLAVVDTLAGVPALQGYHLLPSVRGDLLAKLDRHDEARGEFARAAALTRNDRERAVLLQRAAASADAHRPERRGGRKDGRHDEPALAPPSRPVRHPSSRLPRSERAPLEQSDDERKGVTMPARLNPYLNFPDNARQAMEFYRSVFGGALTVSTFGEFGQPDSPEADKVMHALLETDRGFTLMASDLPAGMEHNPGSNIAISLSGDEADELRGYWDKLSGGGTVTMPLEKQVWGDEFGMCVDQFGVHWMVNISEPQG